MAVEELRLTCSSDERRGRRISRDTVVQLIGRGAGHCYRPDCPTGFLWHQLSDGRAVKLAEVAHVIAASISGPRADPDAASEDLANIGNLVLLCPTCHKIVDSAPEEFSVRVIDNWKSNHETLISNLWGVHEYGSRRELSEVIGGALDENRAAWDLYGPDSSLAGTLESDASAAWRHEVLTTIIPNNRKMLQMLKVNRKLLTDKEKRTVEKFRLHATALESRHLGGVTNKAAPRFPQEFTTVAIDREL